MSKPTLRTDGEFLTAARKMIVAEAGKVKPHRKGRMPDLPQFEAVLERMDRASEIANRVATEVLNTYDLAPGSELQQLLIFQGACDFVEALFDSDGSIREVSEVMEEWTP